MSLSEQGDLFNSMTQDEKDKVNVFDWKAEWPGVMKPSPRSMGTPLPNGEGWPKAGVREETIFQILYWI